MHRMEMARDYAAVDRETRERERERERETKPVSILSLARLQLLCSPRHMLQFDETVSIWTHTEFPSLANAFVKINYAEIICMVH
jgi:hypothetical protein